MQGGVESTVGRSPQRLRQIGAVYYNNPCAYGLTHTGDNETGEGDGDDETIVVDLESAPRLPRLCALSPSSSLCYSP